MSIESNLRQLRLNCGMTQEQAAEKLGVTRQAVSSYESGRTRPDIDMLIRLSEIYGTDLDGILYGEDRALKNTRIVRMGALALGAVITALTVIASALLYSANRLFAVPEGRLSQEPRPLPMYHFRLTGAWKTVDGIILFIAPIGFILLLALLTVRNCRISMKDKCIYTASLAGAILLISALFGIFDPVFPVINYLITPMRVTVLLLILFAVHLLIEFFRRRQNDARG